MKSVLKYLLLSENGADIVAFLRSRGPQAYVIAPDWVREHVFGPHGALQRARWSSQAPESSVSIPDKTNFIVLAENADEERAIELALRSRPGVSVYGLFGHIFPAVVCSAKAMSAGRPTANIRRYAILCVPRSGSRYFSAVLSNRGVGSPREHIREPMAQIISQGNFGFRPCVEMLERFGQKNDIFGTKLISTFFLRASHFKMSELMDNVCWMVERGYRIVALERSLNETVISSYIAFLMRQWHFFGKMNDESRTKLDSLVFDDGAAWDEYVRFRSEKLVFDAISDKLGVPRVPYAEIESDANEVADRLCKMIGVNSETLVPGSAPVPVVTRDASPTYRIFADRLSALLDRRAADIEAATVKKVRALTSLNPGEAEHLVADGSMHSRVRAHNQ